MQKQSKIIIEHNDKKYEMIRASDVVADGMWLELYEITESISTQILGAFWSDTSDNFTFYAYREQLPFEVVEDFIKKARELLPPVNL